MSTINTAAAPSAPTYLVNCKGMEVCLGYISFYFNDEVDKNRMVAELASDVSLKKVSINEYKSGNPVDVHYGETQRDQVKEIAKAISEAYGIPVL